jgi:hypothetical protein
MSLKKRAASRAEIAYGDGSGQKVNTVYVITSTYKTYQKFLALEPQEPLQYRYLYDEKQLELVLKNKLPLSEIKLLFLPYWYKHPRALSIFQSARKIEPLLLKPLYSDDTNVYIKGPVMLGR